MWQDRLNRSERTILSSFIFAIFLYLRSISFNIFAWLGFGFVSALGWKLSALVAGVGMYCHGYRWVDVKSEDEFGVKSTVFETQRTTVRVASEGVFGLMGALGFTQAKVVSERVPRRRVNDPAVGMAGLALIVTAASGLILGDVLGAGTGVAAVATLFQFNVPKQTSP